MKLPRSRPDAVRQASTKYYTGKPCKNGHIAPRYTLSSTCTMCLSAHVDRVRKALKRAKKAAQKRSKMN